MSDDETRAATALADSIKPMLAGKGPAVQSVVLADLTALWLAGHRWVGVPSATQEAFREQLLRSHIELVRTLLPFADAEIDRRIDD